MTAGRSAGTEQGQGRECAICDDSGIYLGHRCSFCQPPWDPSPPVPPGRDSGRDEAREAVASLIAGFVVLGHASPLPLHILNVVDRDAYMALADAVAALLRDGTTT